MGTVADRIISLSDLDMRHGRKSKSKVFAGYKRHIAVDADIQGLIHQVKIAAANISEHELAAPLLKGIDDQGGELVELQIDRGYLASEEVIKRHENGLEVISKPPTPRHSERFTKYDFDIDFEAATVTCPAGVSVPLQLGKKRVSFPASECRNCLLKKECLSPKATSKKISLHPQEEWYREMSNELSTTEGRAKRRERISVEHALARVSAIQGNKARLRGRDKNQFELECVAVVNNCYVLDGALKDREAA